MIGNQITTDMRSTVDRTTTADDPHDARIRTAAAQSRRYIQAIAILQGTYLAVVLGRSWFLSDDLENFGLAHDRGFSLDYLRLNVFKPFAPVHQNCSLDHIQRQPSIGERQSCCSSQCW